LIRAFSNVSPPFIYFADRTNLDSMRLAPVIVFDGTFAENPREIYHIDYEIDGETRTTAGQTYTMHAVFSDLPTRKTSFLCGKLFINIYYTSFQVSHFFLISRKNGTSDCFEKFAKH